MTPSRGHVWLVEVIFLLLDGHNIPLGLEVQLSSLNNVQVLKAPRHGYPCKFMHGALGIFYHSRCHNCFFKDKDMVVFPKKHSQGPKTCIYYSKLHSGNVIINHRPMMP